MCWYLYISVLFWWSLIVMNKIKKNWKVDCKHVWLERIFVLRISILCAKYWHTMKINKTFKNFSQTNFTILVTFELIQIIQVKNICNHFPPFTPVLRQKTECLHNNSTAPTKWDISELSTMSGFRDNFHPATQPPSQPAKVNYIAALFSKMR